jgi:hypothetical protein
MIDPATSWFEIAELPLLEPASTDASPGYQKGRKRKTGHDNILINHWL